MEIILKTSGVGELLKQRHWQIISVEILNFMNQINEAYTYVQVPLKMNEKNAKRTVVCVYK